MNASSFGERIFAYLKISSWRSPGFWLGPKSKDRRPYKKKAEEIWDIDAGKAFTSTQGQGLERCCQKPEGARRHQKSAGSKKDPALGSFRGSVVLLTLWFQASGFQNCERIDVCFFFVCLFLAVLGLHCCVGFSLVVASGGYSLNAVPGLLIVEASLVMERGL